MISEGLIVWNRRIDLLHYAEHKLEKYVAEGKITKQQRKKLKKIISKMWIDIWKFHPDNNPLLEEAFELNFG
ncbi:unnamed protein product [marine sediment metagenome]|uniref:Uncharacterized protein n=1 Tax=marine sediment metagenome TaxID=412755 RepID=X0XID1_9ZZZZ